MRSKINLFKDANKLPGAKPTESQVNSDDDNSDDGFPEITDLLEEMTVKNAQEKLPPPDLTSSVGMHDDMGPIRFD